MQGSAPQPTLMPTLAPLLDSTPAGLAVQRPARTTPLAVNDTTGTAPGA